MMLSLRASSKQTFSFSIFLFFIHQFHVPSSFCFWCLVQSGLSLLEAGFLCYSSTALAGGYSCVTLTLVDFVSPANCHQPETRAVGHPCNPFVRVTFLVASLLWSFRSTLFCTPCKPKCPNGVNSDVTLP